MALDTDARLDTEQAAAYLGPNISPKTLQNWRWQGRGPRFLKVGGKVFYRQSDLERFLERCERASTSDAGPRAA